MDTPVPIPNTEVKHFYGEDSESENSKLLIFFCLFLLFFTYFYKLYLINIFIYVMFILGGHVMENNDLEKE